MSNSLTRDDIYRCSVPEVDSFASKDSASVESPRKGIRAYWYLFFPGEGSGIGRYTHEAMLHLAARPDVHPTLVCTPTCHWQNLASYQCWPGLREISHARRFRRRLRFVAGQFVNPLRFLRYASKNQADILHFSNINHVTFPIWESALHRCRAGKVATVHDVFRERGFVSRSYDNGQLSRFYRSMDALLVHGTEQAEQLESVGVHPDRVILVPHGPYDCGNTTKSVGELRRQYGLPLDRQIALAFGNVRDDKNLDLLIRAIAQQREPVQLLVAGRFNSRQQISLQSCQRLSEDLGICDRVTFLNEFIEAERIPELFKLCDWVALPYSKTFTSQSGVFAVAMQYDRPVVASRVGGVAAILDACDVGVGVEPDDVSSLTTGIASMIGLVVRERDFEFARYRARYSWEENARITRETYQRILSGMPLNR